MLEKLKPVVDPRLIVGPETMDDAAVVAVSDDRAICFTADFITPLVDDAATWGAIAAANSLSDVFAMGAKPLAALNLVCWPNKLPGDLLADVLQGGARSAAAAGCMIVGGHTVDDKQPKYGLAVIGTVDPQRVVRNQGAQPGDRLYLTKPLGTGVLATAIKADRASDDEIQAAVDSMCELNDKAAEAALAAGVRAMTDVTGFGLGGHLVEMLDDQGPLGVELSGKSLPVLPGFWEHLCTGKVPGGTKRNREAFADRFDMADNLPDGLENLLFDPQTSGGLLVAIPETGGEVFAREAYSRGVSIHYIGAFTESGRVQVQP
ncbi:MAG: selenide, water dikinase SelD [Planctomycetes bacterium]|nr:selenide, water dikinase SelD [Planctomycetota bacterium]